MFDWLALRERAQFAALVSALHPSSVLAAQQVSAFFRGPVVSMAVARTLGPQAARDPTPLPDWQTNSRFLGPVTKNFARVRAQSVCCAVLRTLQSSNGENSTYKS